MPYATNKGADQPEHLQCCLDSIISLVSISKISSSSLGSVAKQAGLSLTRLETPKTGFLVTRLIYFIVHEASFAGQNRT